MEPSLSNDRATPWKVEVVAEGVRINNNLGEIEPVERDPGAIRLADGIGGWSRRMIITRSMIRPWQGVATVRFDSQEGGTIKQEFKLD
ncbi:hypothetical protein BH23PLA1_BH23PLA1_35550 [soil metagenome]